MERIISSIDKNYDVAVFPKGNRKYMIQHWSLSSTSAINCKYFAIDILSSMTLDEIFNDEIFKSDKSNMYIERFMYRYNISDDEPIGYDIAENGFTFDIYVDKYVN